MYNHFMDIFSTIVVFILAAAVTWYAGIWLARAVDAIDTRFDLGSAFGGLLLLGIATSLPEIAVAVTAAIQHQYGIIIGTLLGGVALQTVLLALFDARTKGAPLTFAAASLNLVLEGGVVVLIVALSIVAKLTPAAVPGTSLSLSSFLILGAWLFGLWLIHRSRRSLPWRSEAIAATPGRSHLERRAVVMHEPFRGARIGVVFTVLAAASVATLAAGYALATTATTLAAALGIGTGFFAATFIALVGSLPNISSGLTSIKLGDYQLAISDIFGGNAFMPALFVVCDLISGHVILTELTHSDVWFAALGIALTIVYVIGLIVRPTRQYLRLGVDSLIVTMLYVLGIVAIYLVG